MGELISAFLGSLVAFNGLPHMIRGICGKSHMTPFSRNSSPVLNVIWGWLNLIVGGALIKFSHPEGWTTTHWITCLLGAVLVSLSLSIFWTNPEAKLPWHKH